MNPTPDSNTVARCPQCQSRFRLTAQHLEAAKGWVQCGVCGHVFFSGLLPSTPAQPQVAQTQPAPAAATPAATPAVTQADAAPTTQANLAAGDTDKAEAASPMLTGLANRMAENERTTMTFGPKLESIILVDPNAKDEDHDHDPGPLPVIEPRPEPGRAAGLGSSVTPPQPRPVSASDSNWVPRQAASNQTKPATKRGVPGWLWWLLAILLALALVLQFFWFSRDKLVANYPSLRPALTQLCANLGCTISLPRDLSQVIILGSDLQTENNGQLLLTVNLANKAQTPMAWPVLELTLTDVEDHPMARRLFAPSEYLGTPGLEDQGIAQQTEVPIALNLSSSDIKAAGYRLRMFY